MLIKRISPDVLQAINIASAGWLGAASNFHPFIATATGSDLLLLEIHSRLHRFLTTWTLKRADYVTCVSREITDKACRLGVDHRKVETVYSAVDLKIFHPPSQGSQTKPTVNQDDDLVVLSLRALRPMYRPLDIAQAIPIVLDECPRTKFTVFAYNNDPSTFAAFSSYLEKHQASQAVQYIDPLNDDRSIAEYYRTADIAISIPTSDGTPLSVLEAMACGTAVIASNLPSLHDWITPDQNGMLIPTGDVDALAAAIIRLLRDSELRKRLASNAALKIQQQGDYQNWIQRMMEIYRDHAK